jgi:hypothetical protein
MSDVRSRRSGVGGERSRLRQATFAQGYGSPEATASQGGQGERTEDRRQTTDEQLAQSRGIEHSAAKCLILLAMSSATGRARLLS